MTKGLSLAYRSLLPIFHQPTQDIVMTHFRFLPLVFALTTAGALVACGTTPAPAMGSAPASKMAAPETMAKMDEQMHTMRAMHEKMMGAKTPEERRKLMPDRMKAMQGGMEMMRGMSDATGGGMKGMHATGGDKDAHHKTMAKHMEMMQTMMSMMQQQMSK